MSAFYDRTEVVDPLTVVIRFKVPTPHAADLMAIFAITDPDMFIKKDGKVALANEEDKQIGTGPFKMVEYVPGSHMYLERFKDYWEKDVPKLDRVEIRIFGDNASMIAALQAGEIDMAFRPASQDAARLQKDPKFTVWVPKTQAVVAVLMINPASEPLKDVRVRQALTVAIDREAINQVAFSGLGIPTGVVVTKNSLAYSPDLELKTTADAAKAAALLKEAGATNPKVKLTYDSADQISKLEAEVIAENLRPVGIDVQLDPTETSVYTQRRTSQQFDLLLSSVSGTNLNPANLEGSFVYLHVNNPFFAKIGPSKEYQAYSQAYDAGLAAKSEAEAKTAWQNALRAIRDGAWVTSLVSSPIVTITSSKVKGLTWTEGDKPVLKYVTISP
jgi:peptide/nickel transport system substrate-binding protein